MSKTTVLKILILLISSILQSQVKAQTTDLDLKNQTITTTATFEATNSITAGSNFIIGSSGEVIFLSGNIIALNPGFIIIKGGSFKALTNANISDIARNESELPGEFIVHQNYPNPFNPATVIRYELPNNEKTRVVVYDMFGHQIKTLLFHYQQAGYHSLVWDGSNDAGQKVSSGIYFYKVSAGKYTITKRAIFIK